MKTMKMTYSIPTKIVFGCGSVKELGELSYVKGKRCLLLKFPYFNREDIISAVKDSASALIVPDKFEENPSLELITEMSELLEKENIDTVIAIGGGSTLDTAKGSVDILNSRIGKILDIVAVPTTAGTGSEVTQYAMITDTKTGNKYNSSKSGVFARIALCDPELTVSMPKSVTANTAIDAISHAVEAYFTTSCQGMIDHMAIESCKRIYKYLPAALKTPDDITARSEVMMGALEGGIALSCCGTVVVHAMGYELSKQLHIPHGLSNAVMMASFVELYAKRGCQRAIEIMNIFDGRFREFINEALDNKNLFKLSTQLIEDTVKTGMTSYGLAKSIIPLTEDDLYQIVKTSSL